MRPLFFVMNTPAVTARLAQFKDAASHVLEAERAALAEIEHCKRQALQLVADSRARAELVHTRAEARIESVRERMTAAAGIRQERICSETASLVGDKRTDVAILAPLDHAIVRVIEEIVGISESS
jgi:vacuolar-type H+-ATPase subunit H